MSKSKDKNQNPPSLYHFHPSYLTIYNYLFRKKRQNREVKLYFPIIIINHLITT